MYAGNPSRFAESSENTIRHTHTHTRPHARIKAQRPPAFTRSLCHLKMGWDSDPYDVARGQQVDLELGQESALNDARKCCLLYTSPSPRD